MTEEEDLKKRRRGKNYQELYNTENPFSIDMLNSSRNVLVLRRRSCKGHQSIPREGKAPGYDRITTKELNEEGDPGIDALHLLWKTIYIAVVMPIFKKKDKMDCNNYRGISLLSHPRKILTHINQQMIRYRIEFVLKLPHWKRHSRPPLTR